VCLSYGVPVAAFVPTSYVVEHANTLGLGPFGYLRTDRKYSVTSSRHATQYAGKDATVVPHDVFCALIAPVECRK
jgi:hypothetical protein